MSHTKFPLCYLGGILCPHTKFPLCYLGEIRGNFVSPQILCSHSKNKISPTLHRGNFMSSHKISPNFYVPIHKISLGEILCPLKFCVPTQKIKFPLLYIGGILSPHLKFPPIFMSPFIKFLLCNTGNFKSPTTSALFKVLLHSGNSDSEGHPSALLEANL